MSCFCCCKRKKKKARTTVTALTPHNSPGKAPTLIDEWNFTLEESSSAPFSPSPSPPIVEASISATSVKKASISIKSSETSHHTLKEHIVATTGSHSKVNSSTSINPSPPSSRLNSSAQSIKYRTQLPQVRNEKEFSLWALLKSMVGKDLTRISMPVEINEPLSFLQRTAEYMEYYYLLNQLSAMPDVIKRMETIVAFIVSGMSSNYARTSKPFNPLLGETFEYNRPDLGFRFVAEQVTHHPPVTAFHVQGNGYVFYGEVEPKIKFWGRSVEVIPKGRMYLKLQRYDEVYTWCYPNVTVSNLFAGEMKLNILGKLLVENLTESVKADIQFKYCDWASKSYYLQGYVYDRSKIKKSCIWGNWIVGLYSCSASEFEKSIDNNKKAKNLYLNRSRRSSITSIMSFDFKLPNQTTLWEVKPRPPLSKKMYGFTSFSMTLNDNSPESKVAPTDSRHRQDLRYLEFGNYDKASEVKLKYETNQRERRSRNEEAEPKWFVQGIQPDTELEEWMFTGMYWSKQWDTCPKIF